jgi:hypothetical protein
MPFSFLSFGRSFDAAFDRAATTELKFSIELRLFTSQNLRNVFCARKYARCLETAQRSSRLWLQS